MREQAYLLRRKLQVIALALGGLVVLFCYCHKLCAHVDLCHAELHSLMIDIENDRRESEAKANRDLCGYDPELYPYGRYIGDNVSDNGEDRNTSGCKHD